MRIRLIAAAAVIAVSGLCLPASAQTMPGGVEAGTNLPTGGSHMGTAMTQDQFNELSDYADRSRRLTREDRAAGKTLEQVLAEDKAAAIALVQQMPLSCEVVSAIRFAAGPETINGQTVQTKTYEAACANGMGYFLVARDPGQPYGFSCFAINETRHADVAAGRRPADVCNLPENANANAAATRILTAAGITGCTVKDIRWVGQNAANHIEFDEIACVGGQGYMVIAALPGARIPVHIETCNQSAARNLPCRMSDNGTLPMTLASFRNVLAEKRIACEATDATTRVIGQETNQHRYVVEFACPQQPHGLVAYIPAAGSTAPFEVVDCLAAARRHAVCALPGNPH